VAELPAFDDGPHLDLIRELRTLAGSGAPLIDVLRRARSGLGPNPGSWTRTSLFLRSFDLSLEQADGLAAWAGWSTEEPVDLVDDLARAVPSLVPRTPDTIHPDMGPLAAKQLALLLRNSTHALWVGLRRELLTRVALSLVGLAEAARTAPEEFVFLALVNSDVVIFAYRASPGLLDEGRIEEWQVVTGSDVVRRYHHALEHAGRARAATDSG
jgi:hypothetical protein